MRKGGRVTEDHFNKTGVKFFSAKVFLTSNKKMFKHKSFWKCLILFDNKLSFIKSLFIVQTA